MQFSTIDISGFMKKLILLCSLLLLASCTRPTNRLSMAGREKHYKIMQITNGTKNVAFIGIKHLTKPKDLAKFKRDIDSLRDDGYTIMYEGVHIGTKDSVVEDVIRRKFRRVTGFNLSAYLDATNIIANIFKVAGVIERSRYDEDICADYSIDSIVLKYEKLKIGRAVV